MAITGKDYFLQSRFMVEIDGIASAGFSEVHLPEALINAIPYREGLDPLSPSIILGTNSCSNLLLKRAFSGNRDLYLWFKEASEQNSTSVRRTIAIILLDRAGQSKARWEITGALPVRHAFSPLNANACSLIIEELEIACEGIALSVQP